MRRNASPELWYLHTNLHGATQQKTGICNDTGLRTAYTAPSGALRRLSPLQSLPQERSQDGRAKTISHRPLAAEALIQSQASPHGIYGSGTVSTPSTSVSPVSIFPPTPHTHSLTHSLTCDQGYTLLGIHIVITQHFTRWEMYVRSNSVARSRNHCCRRSAKMPPLALLRYSTCRCEQFNKYRKLCNRNTTVRCVYIRTSNSV
jgi:hypothetical protein